MELALDGGEVSPSSSSHPAQLTYLRVLFSMFVYVAIIFLAK